MSGISGPRFARQPARPIHPGKSTSCKAPSPSTAASFFPEHYEDWIQTERIHLAEVSRRTFSLLTTALAAAEQFDEAIVTARRVVAADPLSEEAHCALIRLFGRTGRLPDAQRQYQELERLLRDQVRLEPAHATKLLLQQAMSGALRSKPSLLGSPPRADASLLSVAEATGPVAEASRLPLPLDRSTPSYLPLATQQSGPSRAGVEREVAPTRKPGAEASLLPLSSQERGSGGEVSLEQASGGEVAAGGEIPTNLPIPPTRFFGREEEIRQLETMLSAGAALVTITGPGGAGKTRLAIEAGRRLCPAYGGAVWFVPLADVAQPELIADALVDALPITRFAQSSPIDRAIEYLGRRPAALLILDNYEHLQETGVEIVRTLRARLPRLACLVTSRHRLNLDGERDVALLPLPTPETAEAPELLLAYSQRPPLPRPGPGGALLVCADVRER